MDMQVAKPLFYPAAIENETKYEKLKLEGSLNTTVSGDDAAVSRMTYPLFNKRSSFKL
jgi:hypothetical protein